MPISNPNFNIEHQYQLYLRRVGQTEARMHPEQKLQVRQAFYGAVGQIIFLFRDEIAPLEENDAVAVMEDLKNQVLEYFTARTRGRN